MRKISRRSFLQGSGIVAAAALGAGLAGCGSSTPAQSETASAEQGSGSTNTAKAGGAHAALTMTAMVPFRNPSNLAKLVQEKYPEVNIEFIPYSGYNGTAYTKELLKVDEMPDIYLGSMYTPSVTDVSDRLIDLSAYGFTDNFTDQRLRDVVDDGCIYLLPLYYSCLGIT